MTVDEFNQVANNSQLVAYEQDFDVWTKTRGRELSQFLNTFLRKKVPLTISSGVATLPSGYQHISSVRSYYTRPAGKSVQVNLDMIENVDWGDIQISSLDQPTKRFPKYTEYPTTIEYLPKDLEILYMDYFGTPVQPIWNFTIVDDEPVYNPTGSVNFEWNSFATNRIAGIFLSMVGINLQDTQLQQFAQMFATENTQQ